MKKRHPNAPSGEYRVSTKLTRHVRVYCEFGLGHGAYTFFHPTAFAQLRQVDIDYVQKDKTKVLFRVHYTNGLQPYGVASQLFAYRRYPVKALLSSYSGFQGPLNKATIGSPYLFIGFLPDSVASKKSTQGLTVNGAQITFKNCDANGNSYLSLFANYRERAPVSYANSWNWGGVCRTMLQKLKNPPSARHMSVDYFMFTETHWGGCGCYGQTVRTGNTANHILLGMTVGLQ